MNKNSCISCGSEQIKFKFTKYKMDIFECKQCNLVFVNPRPTIEELKKYYETEYEEGSYILYSESKDIRSVINKKRIEEISKFSLKGKLLDVACATGAFLDAALDYDLDTYGVELSTKAANTAKLRHKNIFNGTLEDAHYPDLFFDNVAMFDIIEHFIDPNSTIAEVNRIMQNNGLLIFTTPDISSWHSKLFGKNWIWVIPPEHLNYFSPKSMRYFLEKSGFEILEMRKNYKIFTIDYMIKQIEYFYPKIFKILSIIRKFLPKSFLLKQRNMFIGELFVIARKL